jgi:hypothetical protein
MQLNLSAFLVYGAAMYPIGLCLSSLSLFPHYWNRKVSPFVPLLFFMSQKPSSMPERMAVAAGMILPCYVQTSCSRAILRIFLFLTRGAPFYWLYRVSD